MKLKAMHVDASYIAQKKALSDVTDIDKQSRLLLKPQRNCNDEAQDLRSEFTL